MLHSSASECPTWIIFSPVTFGLVSKIAFVFVVVVIVVVVVVVDVVVVVVVVDVDVVDVLVVRFRGGFPFLGSLTLK